MRMSACSVVSAMERTNGLKLPISRLPYASQRKFKQFKSPSTKRLEKRERDRTRVTLGESFGRWRALCKEKGFKNDEQLADFFMDSYQSGADVSTPTPLKKQLFPAPKIVEKPLFATPSALTAPLLAKCPSCGFVWHQWCVQNGNAPIEEHQPESIEVTLELEQEDDPVSGAEEADEESDVVKEEELDEEVDKEVDEEVDEEEEVEEDELSGEENSDEDWFPSLHYARTNPMEMAPGEDEEDEEEAEADEDEEREEKDGVEPEHRPGKRKLCPECGSFYKKIPHECEHKTKLFACNICGRRCVSETALKIHNGVHSERREHACKCCHANFHTRVDKLAHELVHQDEKDPYRCPECVLSFATFRERKEHIKQHGNPLQCRICGIVFTERQGVVRHMSVHTGKKAFKCPMCERCFKQASHLKSHVRLHTGERPYSCNLCDKSFNHNVSLKSHMQRYHPTEDEDTGEQSGEGINIKIEPPEMGEDGNQEKDGMTAVKRKCKIPLTGRPKGRPKRYYLQETDKNDDESE